MHERGLTLLHFIVVEDVVVVGLARRRVFLIVPLSRGAPPALPLVAILSTVL